MKNISCPLFKSQRLAFVISLFLLSCNAPETREQEDENEASIGEESDRVILTHKQFETSAMELGGFREYSFGSSMKINGTIDVPPEGRAEISNYYGGYVRNLSLLTGQQVKKGEVLFTLENPEYIEMQQAFLEAKSQLAYLKSDYERQGTLSEENIASRKSFLRAESEYHTTRARVESLKKKLALLNIDPESVTSENIRSQISVYAPISGFVTQVNIRNGAFLSPADIAVSLINTEHLHVELNLFEKNITNLKEGQSIRFRLPDDRESSFEAEVFMIGKTIELDDRMVNVHAHLKDETLNVLFTPGMYVEAEIYADQSQSLSLPSEAVIEASGGFFVLALIERRNEEIAFAKKEVIPGATVNGLTEILNASEFRETEEFLVKGAFNLIM